MSTIRFEAPPLPPLAAFRDRREEAAEQFRLRRDAGYAEGFNAGYEAGLAQAEVDAEAAATEHRSAAQRLDRLAGALQQAAADLARRDAVALAAIESDVFALAAAIAEEIVGYELRAADAPVLDALARVARLLPDRGTPVVRVHPDDAAVAEEAIDPARWNGDVEIVADPGIERGGCVVDVGPCRIDGQIGPAIERLRAAWT